MPDAVVLDTHHHTDFLVDPLTRRAFLTRAAERGVAVVSQTLLPSSFLEQVGEPAPRNPRLAVGLHPWQLGDPHAAPRELGLLEEALALTRFLGEVGLDFSPRRLGEVPADRQVNALSGLLRQARQVARTRSEPTVASIHAVRSVSAVLDLLDDLDLVAVGVVPVLHRFGGTSDELTRAIRLGAHLSAHPHLLATKRGRAYLRQVPLDRLLLESDLPEHPRQQERDAEAAGVAHAGELTTTLRATLSRLSALRGEDVGPQLAETQALLYGVS